MLPNVGSFSEYDKRLSVVVIPIAISNKPKILDMKKDLIFEILFIISVSNTIRLIYFEENYD